MYYLNNFDHLPLWLLLLLLVSLILIMIEVGYLVGRQAFKEKPNDGLSTMATGVASLLAFILAITFNMSAGRQDARKLLVVEESNSIGTAYLRSDLIPPSLALQSKALLREYTEVRLVSIDDPSVVNQMMLKSENIHNELWKIAIKVNETLPGSTARMYIESINDVIDMHMSRAQRAIKGRIPITIWITLFLLVSFAMMLSGLQNGAKHKPRMLLARIPFSLAFAITLTLIVELDRPARSLIDIDQSAMISLQNSMK